MPTSIHQKLGIGLIFAAIATALTLFAILNRNIKVVKIGNTEIQAEVADTKESRELGLGEHDKLIDNQGMLFIFDKSDTHGIWMKNVEFPIDVIWLNQDKKIVYIEESMQPVSDRRPPTFHPDDPALYVIEVPNGFVERYNISDGDQANW